MPAYSGFEGTTADGQLLCDLLGDAGVKEVDVVGIAFDYCVRATAIDAVVCGIKTNVLKDLTAAIHPDGGAEEEMASVGVTVHDSRSGISEHQES
jgi:nicotinamidase/pyrazinamidase